MVKRIGVVVCLMLGLASPGASGAGWFSKSIDQLTVPKDPASVGYLNLSKRHPDGADGPTEFATDYAPGAALQRLDQMRGFLASFKQLSAQVRSRLSEAELRRAGNSSGEMQSIGFHNIPLIVEGTLLKQDYQLRQVEYELAQLRHLRGEATEQAVDRARRAYAEATKRFQAFWDTKRPTD
ncbi:MAG: hypothetical protein H0W53_20225 [Acidobacteria bacterium]|nr:hypothetical protein [Acidobacteriota bacterium]